MTTIRDASRNTWSSAGPGAQLREPAVTLGHFVDLLEREHAEWITTPLALRWAQEPQGPARDLGTAVEYGEAIRRLAERVRPTNGGAASASAARPTDAARRISSPTSKSTGSWARLVDFAPGRRYDRSRM